LKPQNANVAERPTRCSPVNEWELYRAHIQLYSPWKCVHSVRYRLYCCSNLGRVVYQLRARANTKATWGCTHQPKPVWLLNNCLKAIERQMTTAHSRTNYHRAKCGHRRVISNSLTATTAYPSDKFLSRSGSNANIISWKPCSRRGRPTPV
jgi:hypothetical protein